MFIELETKNNQQIIEKEILKILNKDDHGIVIFNTSDHLLNFHNENLKVQNISWDGFKIMSLVNNDIVCINLNKNTYEEDEFKLYNHKIESGIIEHIKNGDVKIIFLVGINIYVHNDFLEYLKNHVTDVVTFNLI